MDLTKMFYGSLTIERVGLDRDWYLLRKVGVALVERYDQSPESRHVRRYFNSTRLDPYVDVEGPAEEWLSIATAIRKREHAGFTRCAVVTHYSKVDTSFYHELYSPRNSRDRPVISSICGAYLADSIIQVLGIEEEFVLRDCTTRPKSKE